MEGQQQKGLWQQEQRDELPVGSRRLFGHVFALLGRMWQEGEAALPPGDPGQDQAWGFARFLDEIPGGFFIYRASGGEEILYANKGLLRMFGCETAQQFRALTGNSFRGMVLPEDLDAVEKSIQRQIASSQYDLDYVEYRVRRRDGQVRWLEDYGHFVRSEPMGGLFYVFVGDATEKRVRFQLEQQQSMQNLIETYDKERALINQEYLRWLEVIEGLSVDYESIFYVDLSANAVLPYRLSRRTQPTFGERFQMGVYTDFVREYIASWVHPEDRELLARHIAPAQIRAALKQSETAYVNYRAVMQGEVQYLQLRLAAAGQHDDGSQVVMGCRRMDDEVRREMEQKHALADALGKANLAMAAKNTFLSNMSHEMRTPLNAVLGFARLAARSTGDEAALHRYLGQVEASGRQLLEMINKVLELSQAQSGSEEIATIECDLVQLSREVFGFLQPQAAEKGVHFVLDHTGVRHSAVYADREKLRQLLLYLANNAITYTNEGEVSITLSEHEQLPNRYAVYRILARDSGIGIEPDDLGRILDAFGRQNSGALSGVHGIGLGLTIVKNIVDMLNGTLTVQSEPGRGSTFTVELRLAKNGPDEVLAGPAGAQPASSRLLLVEDNPLNREIETELLQEAGFEIETAEDGSVAVQKVQAAAPGWYGLVLMDLQMPVMDGWAAARAIRALPNAAKAGVPIIALSANTMPEDLRRSRECGMDAHLQKPVDLPALLEAIRQVQSQRGGCAAL